MTAVDRASLEDALERMATQLAERRAAADHWDGVLASSALSTATAVLALHLAARARPSERRTLEPIVQAGVRWLIDRQNTDGGWGDTVRSRSNISTTAIVWAALSAAADRAAAANGIARSDAWLREVAGEVTPQALRAAILRRYGTDRTFSVPILTVLALAGKLGADTTAAWRSVPQLPFELAALPHAWFQHLRLPVVSYALPALIAIGQVRHRFAPSRNPVLRVLRQRVIGRTSRVLREIQPESGGYLEATPLTSFVVMSMVSAGQADGAVVDAGITFLCDSARSDGSWPIDTNLATWVTTLSVGALAETGVLPVEEVVAIRRWLIGQQSTREHPFTHAAPGAWAWTPLSGGVADADDTSGAMIALGLLGQPDAETSRAAAAGARWLLGVQNRDGGLPTFCPGWGTLPFDRSTPEITAHALRAWSAWHGHLDRAIASEVGAAAIRALHYLARTQRPNGSWVPLWFGHEAAAGEENPAYGTARVLIGLEASLVRDQPHAGACRRRAIGWLLDAQNDDGGWGGDRGVRSSIEETGVVLSALSGREGSDVHGIPDALRRGVRWVSEATRGGVPAATPIGLYFARLWYYEELYPLIFAVEGLGRAMGRLGLHAQRTLPEKTRFDASTI